MTEFIFLCPHVFSIWPSALNAPPSLHKPPGDSRKPHCTSLALNLQRDPLWARLITTCVSGLTLIQQVMRSGDDMLQMEKQIKINGRLGIAAQTGN